MKKILVLMMCLISNIAYSKEENCKEDFFKTQKIEKSQNFNSKILHTLIVSQNGISGEKCIYKNSNVITLNVITDTKTKSDGDFFMFDVTTTLSGLRNSEINENKKENNFSYVNIEIKGDFKYEFQNGFSTSLLMKKLTLPLAVEIDYINNLFNQRKPVYSDNDFDVYMMVN